MTQEATSDRYHCERCGGVLRVQLMGTTVCSSCGTSYAPEFEPQEATSAPDSGQLPSEITAAIDAYEIVVDHHRSGGFITDSYRRNARAELTAKLLKWRDEEVKAALKANAESISAALWGSR